MGNLPAGSPEPADRAVAGRMAAAASAWLASLDRGQHRLAQRDGPRSDPEAEADRRRWHYTPTDHGGLTLGQQHPAQQSLAMQLVASGLSTAGYVTVSGVMGLENVLDRTEGFPRGAGHDRRRDPGRYYLRVFGEPGGAKPWGWRLGGHHVSLNNLVVDGRVVAVTPCFLGANPAASPLLGDGSFRLLGATEDLARELVRSLPPALAAQAVLLDRAPSDIVSRNRPQLPAGDEVEPGPDGTLELTARPIGLPGSELDGDRRELLRALVSAYTGRVPDGLGPSVDLDAVHLAWAGSTEPGRPHYYRLHGPRLLAEWDNTQSDGNHAHSVWRDPVSDFGADVLAGHRAAHHAG
ncbi:Protein of unknown function [Blastococcus sp. DSM 46786]|uniref:DUF3500 domain-containing protein n=1 Tax=Blastococcus sp. DSM 46786 TaxID=1798227 RepID=UPI0008BFFA04|nr:DUF3500 domain-containing protein [Blastococcus sp. DSM 46786]SEL70499.1 Protein of unknown function [Blastococcus sp. DSM 46786]